LGLCVTLVSGPRRSGKSAVVRTMIDRLWARDPHYIRLVRKGGNKSRPQNKTNGQAKCPIASARWIEYDPALVFEVLPEALAKIHKKDRFGSVVIEADTDASLRHAYPYDHHVFVMSNPERIDDIFRNPHRAALEFHRALDDTQAFANEMFGLGADPSTDHAEPQEERSRLTESQIRSFLGSALGDELATRIQLRTAYHGLVESDVVVVNTKIGRATNETDECIWRVESLLERLNGHSHRPCAMFVCDPCDTDAKFSRELLDALKPMCLGGR